MKNKMIKVSTKISVAMFFAASALTMAPITAHAAEETAIVEEVAADEMVATEEATECKMSAPETESQEYVTDDQSSETPADGIPTEYFNIQWDTDYVSPFSGVIGIDDVYKRIEEQNKGQGDVIEDQFAVPEVEGQGDVIEDQFAVPEVEGQGDVIDDEFAVTEGWGDLIDDEFAVTEGWGDLIDDEFAVTEGWGDLIDDEFAVAEEAAEYVTDAELIVDDSCMETVSFVAAVSDAPASASISDKEIKDAYDAIKVKDEDKSVVTETIEVINKLVDPTNYISDIIAEEVDGSDVLGVAEKELVKELSRNALSTVYGSAVPGAGTPKKILKASESFSKMLDAPTVEGKILNGLDCVKNGVEAAVCAIPGGGLVVGGVEAAGSVLKYAAVKLVSWLW